MSNSFDSLQEDQNDHARYFVKIDPALQTAMDPYITIARATFANGADQQSLAHTVLLAFAGMRLAKCVRKKRAWWWVGTEELGDLKKAPDAPVDLTPFMATIIEKKGDPQMMESLRLIITDVVTVGRKTRREMAENITMDTTLLAFAGCGLASFKRISNDKWVWAPDVTLIDRYQMGNGIGGVANGNKAKLVLDDILKFVFENLFKMARLRTGHNVSKRIPTITTLLLQECHGEAIAYIDGQGRLAWKASGKMRKAFEEGGPTTPAAL
jgi:hypothetical protein